MEDYKFLYEERKVSITPEFYSKMQYLTRGSIIYLKDKYVPGENMKLSLFYDMIIDIAKKCSLNIEYLPENKNKINYDTSNMETLACMFKELLPDYEDSYEIESAVRKIDKSEIGKILDISYKLNEEVNNFYLINNLVSAKEDCIKNMAYFVNENDISIWSNEYDKAIENKDTKKMKAMLDDVQESVLDEWDKYLNNMEQMNDDNFAFLGHSTNSTKFDKEFYSRYVSTSLLTEDLNDTYRSGFGFILAPKNIVGANSQDMYVNNYVNDEDMLLNNSLIKKIDHPKRIIEECKEIKKDNVKNGINRSVYSEVIIDGFEPVGIFCFSDGSKSLNYNEQSAKELAQSFPNLKIYTFDTMKRKQGQDLVAVKLKLINNLQQKFSGTSFDITEDMLSRYDYFFTEFEKAKESDDYDESVIEEIFEENVSRLSIFDNDPQDLFNSGFSDRKIKYILSKNINYNIDMIFDGNARAFVLNKLKCLYPYKDEVKYMFEGFDDFIELINNMDITDEMMKEINGLEKINFLTISTYLSTKRMVSIETEKEQTKTNIDMMQEQYKELLKEYQERTNIEEKHNYYRKINFNKFYKGIIKDDYISTLQDIKDSEENEASIKDELNQIIKKIEELDEKEKTIDGSYYIHTNEFYESQRIISESKNNIAKLSKHSFINRKKIREEKKRLSTIEKKDNEQSSNFEENKAKESINIKSEILELKTRRDILSLNLSYTQESKLSYEEQLAQIKIRIKDLFMCDTIEDIDRVIDISDKFMQNYDSLNPYYLGEVKNKLNNVSLLLNEQQNKYKQITEEESTIAKAI